VSSEVSSEVSWEFDEDAQRGRYACLTGPGCQSEDFDPEDEDDEYDEEDEDDEGDEGDDWENDEEQDDD